MASMVQDRNTFILEASKLAMHAILSNAGHRNRDPKGIAQQARRYAIQLWLAMRAEP